MDHGPRRPRNVRLAVESRAGKPVFVGIARTSDVSSYLRGISYTSVTDVDYSPFHASYRDHGGDRTDTDISAGAKVPLLGTLGWVSLGGALVLLITAGTLMYLGLRTPRPPAAPNVTLEPSPSAS
jgi:hypothetical protein